jgi:hypothetical protein
MALSIAQVAWTGCGHCPLGQHGRSSYGKFPNVFNEELHENVMELKLVGSNIPLGIVVSIRRKIHS